VTFPHLSCSILRDPVTFPHLSCSILRDPVDGIFILGQQEATSSLLWMWVSVFVFTLATHPHSPSICMSSDIPELSRMIRLFSDTTAGHR
jgi:hypothetical protein